MSFDFSAVSFDSVKAAWPQVKAKSVETLKYVFTHQPENRHVRLAANAGRVLYIVGVVVDLAASVTQAYTTRKQNAAAPKASVKGQVTKSDQKKQKHVLLPLVWNAVKSLTPGSGLYTGYQMAKNKAVSIIGSFPTFKML